MPVPLGVLSGMVKISAFLDLEKNHAFSDSLLETE